MKLDVDQSAAVNVTKNAVVSAGAGSGKTSVLTKRYLRLVLEERRRVGEILALTFTRKAAAEMYERIYRALREHEGDSFVRDQLAEFDSAVISTLDSFCSSIARNGCTRFGVPSTFTIDERALSARCEELALAFLLEHSTDPVVADLVRLNRFAVLWKDGLANLAVNHFAVADERPLATFLPAQEEFLRDEHDRLASAIEAALGAIAALDPDGPKCVRSAQEIVGRIDRVEALPRAQALLRNRELGTRVAAALAPLSGVNKSCGNGKHPEVPLYKEYVDELKNLTERYLIATHTLAVWDDAEAFTRLLETFRERVVSEKRRLALLSYHDVTGLAIRTLTEDTQLRAFYKDRFSAVMIDEFQDNNEEQKALLYLIAERTDVVSPGVPPADALDAAKLFFVGDEKQSIYRFRGADVSVFRALAAELSGTQSDPQSDLRLGANYRSEPGLIHFFNELFTRVFADAREAYEARFEPLRWRAPSPGVVARVELWRLEQRASGDQRHLDDTDAEAYHIASWIRSSVEHGSLLVGSGVGPDGMASGRPAQYSDFAILMRSSGNQIRLERTLRLFGVPYVSQAARSLFIEAPVNDIYQVLQLVLYPNDRVAYAGYLRSPLAGVSDEGIVRQLLEEQELMGPVPGHSAGDAERIALARERYRELCGLADSSPVTDLIRRIWYNWGYRYHLLRLSEHTPYLEYYDLFWELAHSFEEQGLAAFLDEVRRHIGQNEKLDELEILRGEAPGVQIMTIHKSKGLEFPVVIVANAGNRGRSASVSARPFYWSDRRGLAFNTGMVVSGAVKEQPANYLYTHELDEEKAQDRAELKRLLYVAATRAESHLVFSGISRDGERSLIGILEPAFDGAREAVLQTDGLVVDVRDLEPVPTEAEHHARRSAGTRSIARLASEYRALPVVDRAFTRAEWTATGLNEALRPDHEDRGATPSEAHLLEAPAHRIDAILDEHDLAARFGTYCHYCIEHADELGLGELASEPPATGRLPAAVRPDLAGDDLQVFLGYGYELACDFVRSPLAARLRAAVPVEHELAFLLDGAELAGLGEAGHELPPGLELVRGKIDLLAGFADHVLVVDFKTDRILDPNHYRVQLEIYRAAAAALYGLPVVSALYHLRTGFLCEVLSDALPDSGA